MPIPDLLSKMGSNRRGKCILLPPKFDSGEVFISILRDFEKVETIRVDIRTLFKKINDMEDVAVGSE